MSDLFEGYKYGGGSSNSEPQAQAKGSSQPKPSADDLFSGYAYGSSTPKAEGSSGPTIPRNRRYEHADSWLGRVVEAFDYPGSANRSGLSSMIKGDGYAAGAKQALAKDRVTTASNLTDDLSTKVHGHTFRYGKDDGEFQWGDLLDLKQDIAVDIATDPLSFVGSIPGKVAKYGSKAAKVVGPLVSNVIAPSGLGAIYGAGSAEKDDDAGDIATRALTGAVAGPIIKQSGRVVKPALLGDALEKGTTPTAMGKGEWLASVGKRALGKEDDKVLNGIFDGVSDWFARTSGKSDVPIGRAHRVADEALQKRSRIAADVFFRRNNAMEIDNLTDVDKLEVDSILKELKDGTAAYRQKRFGEVGLKSNKVQDISDPAEQATFNSITREANEYAERELFPNIMKGRKENITKAISGMEEHNKHLVKMYNEFKFGVSEATDDGVGLVGLKYHTDDMKFTIPDKDATALDKIFGRSKVAGGEIKEFKNVDSEKYLSMRDAGVSPDDRYYAYSKKFSENFLDDKEKEALQIVFDYRKAPIESGGGVIKGGLAALDGAGRLTDGLNNWTKKNLLFASLTWLKNNFWDNATKAFIEGGLVNSAKTVGHQIPYGSKLNKDLMDIYRGNTTGKLPVKQFDPLVLEALQDGALEGPMMQAMLSDALSEAIDKGSKQGQQIANSGKSAMQVVTDMKNWWEKGLEKTVGVWGSGMEGAGRFTLYKTVREDLVKKGMPVDEARRKAAEVTEKAFFNYGELTHFERSFMKRIMPFYSFYSKNLPYWLEVGFDPKRAARLFKAQKLPGNMGEKPTEADRRGMPEHLNENNARILGRSKDGLTVGYTPTFSGYDAANMLNYKSIPDQLLEKTAPAIKSIWELAPKGNDWFLKQPTYPSDRIDGQKPLFSSGYKWLPGINPLVYNSSKGSPMTDSDAMTFIDKASSNFQVPVLGSPITGQVAGTIGKIKSGRQGAVDAILETAISPMKTTLLTPEEAGKNIRYKSQSAAKEKTKKAKDEKRARDRRKKAKYND